MVLRDILNMFDINTENEIEHLIKRRLIGEIDKQQMFRAFDSEKDGVALNSQTATRLSEKVEELLSVIKSMDVPEKNNLKEKEDERVEIIRKHLLDNYKGDLSVVQVNLLNGFIYQRLEGKFSTSDFKNMLDYPISNGGVGLDRRTAKRFAKEAELIIEEII